MQRRGSDNGRIHHLIFFISLFLKMGVANLPTKIKCVMYLTSVHCSYSDWNNVFPPLLPGWVKKKKKIFELNFQQKMREERTS